MSEDAAEKEASEVLHSLLSVERIEKQEIIVTGVEQSPPSFHTSHNDGGGDNEATIQYTPISISHSLFSAIDGTSHFANNMDDSQVVIWEGHAIVDPLDSNNMTTIYTGHQIDDTTTDVESVEVKPLEQKLKIIKPEINNAHQVSASATNHNNKKTRSSPPKKKRKLSSLPNIEINNDITKLEDNPSQVKDKFKRGCECQDESCFRGLNPETVFKHRNNIAELTKGEHDMYLMGVTMASLSNPDTTVRQRERRRLRAQYIYQGRRVCLDAFLYLENCTHYQLKRIRKHVMTHGVAPRVHGNHGKKPHNTFSLDIYCHAREFLKQYLEQHTGESDILNMKQSIQLPWDVTRKNLHDAYKEYGQILEPGVKLMGCSTFRHFLKDQFPHVKFCKLEPKSNNQSQQNQQQQHQQITVQAQINSTEKTRNQQPTGQQSSVQKCIINNEVQQVIPLVVSSNENQGNQHQQSQTFLVTTPVPQLISNANIVTSQNAPNNNSTTYSYQITNGYLINDQGNIVSTTLTNNGQNQASYFSRMQ